MTFYIVRSLNQDTEKQFTSSPMPFETAVALQRMRQELSPRDQVDMVSVNPSACSPALREQSDVYPERYNGRVPLRVKMLMDVSPDLPWYIEMIKAKTVTAAAGQEYEVYVNSHGAVTAVIGNEMLGLRPDEFEVTAWHNNNGRD